MARKAVQYGAFFFFSSSSYYDYCFYDVLLLVLSHLQQELLRGYSGFLGVVGPHGRELQS